MIPLPSFALYLNVHGSLVLVVDVAGTANTGFYRMPPLRSATVAKQGAARLGMPA